MCVYKMFIILRYKTFTMKQFETIGYFLEYIIDGKFIGTKRIDKPDRDQVGYYSRINATATEDIILDNSKKIKSGQDYYTRIYPLNGRRVK